MTIVGHKMQLHLLLLPPITLVCCPPTLFRGVMQMAVQCSRITWWSGW